MKLINKTIWLFFTLYCALSLSCAQEVSKNGYTIESLAVFKAVIQQSEHFPKRFRLYHKPIPWASIASFSFDYAEDINQEISYLLAFKQPEERDHLATQMTSSTQNDQWPDDIPGLRFRKKIKWNTLYFSKPVFYKEKRTAFLATSEIDRPTSSGCVIKLEKKAGEWVIVDYVFPWVACFIKAKKAESML